MSIFFATQDLKKDNGTDNPSVQIRPINKVGILGGGLMGGGIAAVTAINAKTSARVQEVDVQGVGRAMGYVGKLLRKDVSRRFKTEADATRILHRVTGTTDLSGFESVPLVIEAVFEDLELKRSMLRKIEEVGPRGRDLRIQYIVLTHWGDRRGLKTPGDSHRHALFLSG